MAILALCVSSLSIDNRKLFSIRLWALSGKVLSHDSSPRWFVWYSGVPASQQNLENTNEICADS
ncbi:unnamed protein product [Brassica rapa]|uniref:Uncharacterized protein n=1 Tax=Brassica campestris TaxID=3711 RepID=A0A8D9LUH9_BRACM|nr:unnamed protein product [Brassica rapa]CAG7887187.1 unnamed protein product [Brassica rapa]CAG7910161.1 unnamed protein product [Brassica rapa]